MLRLEPEQHAALRAAAAEAGVSLNTLCARRLHLQEGLAPDVQAAAECVARARAVLGEALRGVVVYGSCARGEAGDGSDVDLLLVVDPGISLTRALYRRWDASALDWDGHPVTPHFVHLPDEGSLASGLWAEVALDGIVLLDRDLGISRCLVRHRRAIAERSLIRKTVHGQPYMVERSPTTRDPALGGGSVRRSATRLRAIEVLFDAESWADVVRECQEAVELALKGVLRSAGIEAPRIHDVSEVLLAESERLPDSVRGEVQRLATISRDLRRDRELAFYGAEDLTPSTFYSRDDAERALDGARFTVALAEQAVPDGPR